MVRRLPLLDPEPYRTRPTRVAGAMKRSDSNRDTGRVDAGSATGIGDVEDVLASSPVVLYTAAFEGEQLVPLWASRNIALILGYQLHEALAPGWWWQNLHPDDRDRAARSGAALLQQKRYSHEYRIRHANGAYIWVLDQMKIVDTDGTPMMIGSWTDVSAGRLQQARLEAAEAHYRRLIETSPYSIFTLDATGTVMEVNAAGERILGRTDLIGTNFLDLLPTREVPRATSLFEQILAGKNDSPDLELLVRRPDGEERLLSIAVSSIRDESAAGVHGIARDITGERAREEHMMLLSTALDRLPDCVCITDADRRVVYANRACERILECDPQTISAERFSAILGGASVLAAMDAALAERGAWRGTFTHARAGREPVPIEIVAVHVVVDEQTLTFAVLRDLSTEVAREQQLRRAERMASVGTLVAGVAHELNNPLTAIAGFAELMLMEPHSDDEREMLELTRREAQRAARIVADLRVIARETQQSAPSRRSAVDLNDVVQHVLKLQRYSLQTSNIDLAVDLAPDLPAVLGNSSELEQVLLNLIVNARQALGAPHSGRRGIGVRTRAGHGRAVLSIADNGPGIPQSELDRIFDPFYTTKSPGEGMGLGLSLVHRIVTEHDGEIEVESTPGAGATFTVSLPLARSDDPAPTGDAARRTSALRVLVVDDEVPIRRALLRFLQRRGHSVDLASDGHEALLLIEQQTYDVILTDLRMPGMGGELLLETLRKRDPAAARRVMFMTGHVARDDAALTTAYADVPVIEKPFSLNELEDRLDALAARLSEE